jgi:uncharacterized RDD family membrane protein YckC
MPNPVDTASELATAEGARLSLRRAGIYVRCLAWLYDFGLRLIVYLVGGMILGQMAGVGLGIFTLFIFGLEWLYPVLFEMLRDGATPGKRALGIMAINDNGTPLTWGSSLMRNLMRAFDFLPVLYGAGLCAMLLGDGSRRLGDWVAGTVVIYRDDVVAPLVLERGEALLAPPVALRLEEQRALIDYVRRDPGLTVERSAELASAAAPLVPRDNPQEARAQLLAMGRYLLGLS